MTAGEIIKQLRKEKGLTLEQLGEKCGVGKSTVRKWEEGLIKNMGRDKIYLLSKALDVTPDYLILLNGQLPESESSEADRLLDIYNSLGEQGQADLLQYADYLKVKYGKK